MLSPVWPALYMPWPTPARATRRYAQHLTMPSAPVDKSPCALNNAARAPPACPGSAASAPPLAALRQATGPPAVATARTCRVIRGRAWPARTGHSPPIQGRVSVPYPIIPTEVMRVYGESACPGVHALAARHPRSLAALCRAHSEAAERLKRECRSRLAAGVVNDAGSRRGARRRGQALGARAQVPDLHAAARVRRRHLMPLHAPPKQAVLCGRVCAQKLLMSASKRAWLPTCKEVLCGVESRLA